MEGTRGRELRSSAAAMTEGRRGDRAREVKGEREVTGERRGARGERDKREEEEGPKRKEKGPFARWKGLFAKPRKRRRVAAKLEGVGGKEPGQD